MSEIEDRRQRAREAFFDGSCAHVDADCIGGLADAIEAATRVRITDDVLISSVEIANQVLATRLEDDGTFGDLSEVRPVIAAALTALGFEVEA